MTPFDALDNQCFKAVDGLRELPFFTRRRVLRSIVRCANDNWEGFEAQYELDQHAARAVLEKAIREQMETEYSAILAIVLLTVVLAAISAVVQYLVTKWLERHPRHINFAEYEGQDYEPE